MIEVLASDNEYYPYTDSCDGTNPTIVSQRWCTLEMSVLRNAPFDLAKGTKIIARGKAGNIKGYNDTWSDTDPAHFTFVIETEPDEVD